jgi:hypothetical protein
VKDTGEDEVLVAAGMNSGMVCVWKAVFTKGRLVIGISCSVVQVDLWLVLETEKRDKQFYNSE